MIGAAIPAQELVRLEKLTLFVQPDTRGTPCHTRSTITNERPSRMGKRLYWV